MKPISYRLTTASKEPYNNNLHYKRVSNLSSKPLTKTERSLLQKVPKFAFSQSSTPIVDYITTTTPVTNWVKTTFLEKWMVHNTMSKLRMSCQNFVVKPILSNITKTNGGLKISERRTVVWSLQQIKELPYSLHINTCTSKNVWLAK